MTEPTTEAGQALLADLSGRACRFAGDPDRIIAIEQEVRRQALAEVRAAVDGLYADSDGDEGVLCLSEGAVLDAIDKLEANDGM